MRFLGLLFISFVLHGAEIRTSKLLWKASLGALITAHGLDVASSVGKPEMQPVYGVRFDHKDMGTKSAFVLWTVVPQLLCKGPRRSKAMVVVNFSIAAGLTVLARRNWTYREGDYLRLQRSGLAVQGGRGRGY